MDPAIGQFIPLILIFVIFYFFLIRPQQRKAKDHKKMVEDLKRGRLQAINRAANKITAVFLINHRKKWFGYNRVFFTEVI